MTFTNRFYRGILNKIYSEGLREIEDVTDQNEKRNIYCKTNGRMNRLLSRMRREGKLESEFQMFKYMRLNQRLANVSGGI